LRWRQPGDARHDVSIAKKCPLTGIFFGLEYASLRVRDTIRTPTEFPTMIAM
jgi:hypothetical protein